MSEGTSPSKHSGALHFLSDAPISDNVPFLSSAMGQEHNAVTTLDKEMANSASLQEACHRAHYHAHHEEPAPPVVPISIQKHLEHVAPPALPKNVLVAVDESEFSRRALIYALRNFATENVVLHIVSTIEPGVDAMMPDHVQKKELADIVSETEVQLVAWVSAIVDAEGSTLPYHVQVAIGEPGPQVCELAESLNVRMVVVGSSGKGAIKRALLGSVSTYLTMHCARPVLVVRDTAA